MLIRKEDNVYEKKLIVAENESKKGQCLSGQLSRRTIPHRIGFGPDDWFYSVVVVLVGDSPRAGVLKVWPAGPDPARGACQSGPRDSAVFIVLVLILPYVLALLGFTWILSGPFGFHWNPIRPFEGKFENPCPRDCGPGGQWLGFIFIWWGIVLVGSCPRTRSMRRL